MTYPNLRIAMILANEKQHHVAELLKISEAEISRKLNHKVKFSATEKEYLSNHYKIPMKKLFKED